MTHTPKKETAAQKRHAAEEAEEAAVEQEAAEAQAAEAEAIKKRAAGKADDGFTPGEELGITFGSAAGTPVVPRAGRHNDDDTYDLKVEVEGGTADYANVRRGTSPTDVGTWFPREAVAK